MTRYLDIGEIGPGRVEVADGGRVEIVSAPGTPGRTIVGEFGELLVTGTFSHFQGATVTVFGDLGVEAGASITSQTASLTSAGHVRRRSHPPEPAVLQRTGVLDVGGGGRVVIGTLLSVEPGGVVNLNPGGTIYAPAVENLGTINDNGGTLVLPEPHGGGAVALGALAWRQRMRRRA
jgi:hypothetical protein